MPNNTDKLIRLAIKGLIKNFYPDAQVFAWNALSHDLSEWAGMFRDDKDLPTHGWIIKRGGTKGEWKNGKRDRRELVYDIWGFYGFASGENVNEDSNSDNEFGEIVDSIYEEFKNAPRLNFDTEVEGHDLLQFPVITTLQSGEETLHFAQGRLVVRLCC